MIGIYRTIDSFYYVSDDRNDCVGECIEKFETQFAAEMWLELSFYATYPIPYPTGDEKLDKLLDEFSRKRMSIRCKARSIYDLSSYTIHPFDALRLQMVGYGKTFQEKKYRGFIKNEWY